MFCNRDNYYKGYIKGLKASVSQNSNKSNVLPNFINILIAIGTVSAAIFAYKTWQDSKYIYKLDNIIDSYYEVFMPSIAADGISLDMHYTYTHIINVDINSIIERPEFEEIKNKLPESIDLNEQKEKLREFYTDEISEKLVKGNPNSYKLISSLEKIKPYLSKNTIRSIDKFIISTKVIEFYWYLTKFSVINKGKNNSHQEIINVLELTDEQNTDFNELIDQIRSELSI